MFVEFSVRPMRQRPRGKDVTVDADTIDQAVPECAPRSMSASIEGSWEQVMTVIRGCHQAHADGHPRVVTTIVVVDDNAHGGPRRLHDATNPNQVQIEEATGVRQIRVEIRQ